MRCVLIARTNKMIRRFPSAADHIVTIARWDELIGKHEFWVYRVKLKKKNKIITALQQGERHQIELTVGKYDQPLKAISLRTLVASVMYVRYCQFTCFPHWSLIILGYLTKFKDIRCVLFICNFLFGHSQARLGFSYFLKCNSLAPCIKNSY